MLQSLRFWCLSRLLSRCLWLALVGALFFPAAAWSHPAVFITLAMQEALPSDPSAATFQPIKGVERSKAPVTFGIPLHNDSNILLAEQLLLVGSNDVQFRVVRSWPNSRIQWLLVDTLVDLKANAISDKFFLTVGKSILSERKLAKETGGTITVDTGAAVFAFRKKGFRLFDSIKVGGKELLASNHRSAIVLRGTDNKEYRSDLDTSAAVSIDENGPIRCVVKAQGRLVASDGASLLGYTLRMHFYKRKQRVRMLFTLRNASKTKVENVTFRSLELVVHSGLSNPTARVATHDGEFTQASLGAQAKVQLFQGDNAFPTLFDKGLDPKHRPSGKTGYTLDVDGATKKSGTAQQHIPLMYAQLASSAGALTVGTRFGAGYWPQGLGLDGDGTLRIGVFPPGNDKPYVIRFNSHITREHMLYATDKADSPRDEFFRFQYPVVAHPIDPDWFNQTETWNLRLVSFKEESDYHKAMKWPTDSHPLATDNRRPAFAIPRYLNGANHPRPHVFSRAMVAFANFLRQPNAQAGAYYLQAEHLFRYTMDQSLHHSDDYSADNTLSEVPALADGKGGLKGASQLPGGDQLPASSPLWQSGTRHIAGLIKWFYVTGDKRASEALLDDGEFLRWQANTTPTALSLAQTLLSLSELASFASDPRFAQKAWSVFQSALVEKTAERGKSAGLDRQRGFVIAPDQATAQDRTVVTSSQGGHLLRAAIALEHSVAKDAQQASQARDVIEGLARFVASQLWVERGSSIGDFGFPFAASVDQPLADPRQGNAWNKGLEDAFLAVAYAYLMSHDQAFLQQGERLLQLAAENPTQTPGFGDSPARHTLQYLVENPLLFATWRPLPLQVQNLGDGRYRLSWVSPFNATKFWFKRSDKPIVPSLLYDAAKGTFGLDPAKHTPFFAADYVDTNPNIVDPGFRQAAFVKVPDPKATYHFAARYLSTDPRKAPTEAFAEPVPGENPNAETPTPPSDAGTEPSPDAPPSDAGTEPPSDASPSDAPQHDTNNSSPDPSPSDLTAPKPGCGCDASTSPSLLWLGLLGLLALVRRRNA